MSLEEQKTSLVSSVGTGLMERVERPTRSYCYVTVTSSLLQSVNRSGGEVNSSRSGCSIAALRFDYDAATHAAIKW